jgi:hypothetical protein
VTIETADEFVARKGAEWKQKPKLFRTKDVGRQGVNTWALEAWTFLVQHNYPHKLLLIERIRHVSARGVRVSSKTKPGDIEYRFGYYTVARNGKAAGRWWWGQSAPFIPHEDLAVLLEKARREGTLR